MGESVHNEVVKVSLEDQKFMSQIQNMGKKSKAMFRQINADFSTLSSSGDWVQAYSKKVTGLEELIKDSQKYAASLRKELSGKTINTAAYDKIATQLSKANAETARYESALGKAKLGLERAKTGVMDLRNEVAMSERTMASQVNALNAQGKAMTADTVKVSGYREQIRSLGAQLQAEQRYLKVIETQLGSTSNEYREQAVVINETKAKIAEYTAAQKTAYSNVGNMGAKFASASDSIKNFSTRNIEAGRAMTAAGSNMMITSFGIGAAFVSATKSAIGLEQAYKENTNLIKKNAEADRIGAQTTIAHMTEKLKADQANHASNAVIKADNKEISDAKNKLAMSEKNASNALADSNKMMKQGRELSLTYGVSQEKIAKGFQELIKTGFSASQAMGAMPSILQASRATGEDYNRVLDVTVQTMNQFEGSLNKMKNAQGQALSQTEKAKYTTNVLASAANATSTSYSSLGEAMSQVGPVMNELGFTMSDTAAIVGVLSNRGIDGAMAGNNLKRAWLQLTSGSSQTQKAIDELGLSIYDSSGKTRNMADIMEDLQGKLKGMSQGDKEIIMKKLFGAYARTAGSIMLDNAASIREVGAATKVAGDQGTYVSKLADKNMQTASAQIDRFKAGLTELGMSFARELLPTITEVAKSLTGLVEGFSKLSPGMKKFIVYAAASVAALGPLGILLGGLRTTIGFTAGGVLKLVTGFGKLKGGFTAGAKAASEAKSGVDKVNSAMNIASNASNVASSGIVGMNGKMLETESKAKVAGNALQQVGTKSSKMGSLMRGASGAIGSLIGIPLTPWGLAAGLAIGAVAIAAVKFGPAIINANRQYKKWGTTLTNTQEVTLDRTRDFTNTMTSLMNSSSAGTQKNTDEINKAFQSRAKEIEDSIDKEIAAINKEKEALGKGYDTTSINKKKKYYEESKVMAEQAAQTVDAIAKGQSESKRTRTAADNEMIRNATAELVQAQIQSLDLSSAKQKQISKELSGTFKGKTVADLQEMNTSYSEAIKKTDAFSTSLKAVKHMNEDASASAKKQNWAKFIGDNISSLSPIWNNYQAQMKENEKNFSGEDLIHANAQALGKFKETLKDLGIPYDDFVKGMQRKTKEASKSVDGLIDSTGKMKNGIRIAANDWNNTIFDPLTGEIKTNAVEEIAKAEQGSKTWNDINLLLKEGKMDVKGQEMVSQAIQQTNNWNSLQPAQQLIIAKVTGKDEIIDAIGKVGLWDSLTPEQKTLISNAQGNDEVLSAIGGIDAWNAMKPKEQKGWLNVMGNDKFDAALGKIKNWNEVPVDVKDAIMNDLATGKTNEAIAAIVSYNGTKGETSLDVRDNTGVGITSAKSNVTSFVTLPGRKTVEVTDGTFPGLQTAKSGVQNYMVMPADKALYANNQNYTPVLNAKGEVTGYMNANANKVITANNQNYQPIADAKGKVTGYMRMNGEKTIKAKDNASATIKNILDAMSQIHDIHFNIFSHSKKNAKGTRNFEGGLATVNDQQGSIFREMIQLPNGGPSFMFGGRNVTIPLPAHSKVIPAGKTRSLLGDIPKFANGLNDKVSSTSLMRNISRTAKVVPVTANNSSKSSNDSAVIAQLTGQVSELSNAMSMLVSAIASQNSKEVQFVVNDQVVMREIAPLVDKAQSTMDIRRARLRGNR